MGVSAKHLPAKGFIILYIFSACIKILCDVSITLNMNENKKKEKGDEKGTAEWNTVEKNSIIPINRVAALRSETSVFSVSISFG